MVFNPTPPTPDRLALTLSDELELTFHVHVSVLLPLEPEMEMDGTPWPLTCRVEELASDHRLEAFFTCTWKVYVPPTGVLTLSEVA